MPALRPNELKRMVDEQLRSSERGIRDKRVLTVMESLDRAEFIDPAQRPEAYDDGPLPIACGQTISQPYIVALMTEALDLQPGERVLEIGTGSGYQAAVLAQLGCRVFSVERIPQLAARARETFTRLGLDTIQVRLGDGHLGWPEAAPFDAVIVTCCAEAIPGPLIEQLRDGGRMVIPLGSREQGQVLTLVEKRGERLDQRELLPVRFVPMLDGAADA